jgi:ABC-type polysaccharide/polyol phosphate transport system ATPase subunit
MGNDIVIRAEGLGKRYLIGHQTERERYTALRDVMTRKVRNFKRAVGDIACGRPNVAGDQIEEFWALKHVSIAIKRGEVVGVIGRNGAGKSTLLKILSRITEPSEGRVEIKGRVASMLEVGTGFHPELTGRENIYLNGAILGMTRAEIKRKFEEIVAFAEVDMFLDTPVKRYSSGMYVRLAFAVAAHLEPEILVVDEVLAVGDQEFQKKCLGKIGDVAKAGRTVLFVSHQLDVVSRLCHTGVLLRAGRIACTGSTADILQAYQQTDRTITPLTQGQLGDATVWISLDAAAFSQAATSTIAVSITFNEKTSLTEACLIFYTVTQQRVALVDFRLSESRLLFDAHTPAIFSILLDRFAIVPGDYRLNVWLRGNVGSLELHLGTIHIPSQPGAARLSLYPEMFNGIIMTHGKVVRAEYSAQPSQKPCLAALPGHRGL